MVNIDPVRGNSFNVQGQDLTGKALYCYPGQHEKPCVIDDKMKMFIFNRLCPADELLPGFNRPGCRSPANAGKRSVTGKGHIFEMITHNLDISKVVELFHQAVIKRLQLSMPDHFDHHRVQIGNVTTDGGFVNFNDFDNFSFIRAYNFGRRIIQQAFSMQGQKEFSAGHVFESSIGLNPVPLFAQFHGNMGPASVPVFMNYGLNNVQVFGGDFAVSDG